MRMLAMVSKTGSLCDFSPATTEMKASLKTRSDPFCRNSEYSCQKSPSNKAGVKQPDC